MEAKEKVTTIHSIINKLLANTHIKANIAAEIARRWARA